MAAEAVCKYGVSALVTGAGRGIGLELCRQLTEAGCNVFATVRKESEALSKIGVTKVITGVDMTSDDIGTVLNAGLGDDLKLDLVINNAGMLVHETFAELNIDAIKKQFDVNAAGPLRVVKAVEARLNEGAKVANITSRMGSIADASSGNMYGYRMSKAALNMASKCLATDLASRRVAVCCLHPGHVATDMGGSSAAVTPAESAAGLLARIEGLTLETSGKFWHMNGEELPW